MACQLRFQSHTFIAHARHWLLLHFMSRDEVFGRSPYWLDTTVCYPEMICPLELISLSRAIMYSASSAWTTVSPDSPPVYDLRLSVAIEQIIRLETTSALKNHLQGFFVAISPRFHSSPLHFNFFGLDCLSGPAETLVI
jgi:hypothetical protein